MFLHCNMRRAKCLRFSDSGKTGEFYFTWRAYLPSDGAIELAQGFSLGCPIDDGYSMAAGDGRVLNDPRFTVELPNVGPGETKHFVLDMFCWEADHSSEETKRLFTNDAAKKLMQLHKGAEARSRKTRESFLSWLQDGDNDVATSLLSQGLLSPAIKTAYESVTSGALKLLDFALDAIKSNSDDYLGTSRSELLYTRDSAGQLRYRWIFDNGIETWFKEEGPKIHQTWRILEANRDNELDCKFLIQIAAGSPTEFQLPPTE
jgi:hypothetical protein